MSAAKLTEQEQLKLADDVRRIAKEWFTVSVVSANELERLRNELERLRAALVEAAKMTEHEADRTLIYNHCMQAANAAGGEQ